MAKVSIIVPCFNEEEALPLFFSATKKVTSKIPAEIEYWFIDDGSKDKTLSIIQKLRTQNDQGVHFISFSRNFGKEAAMYAGLQAATGDYVAIMDADLQDPPELLQQMYVLLKNDQYDCVGARRISRTGEGKLKSFLAKLFYTIINCVSDTNIVPDVRDFRMMTRQFVDSVLQLPEYHRFSKGIFSWVGFKTKYLTYSNRNRVAGNSHWSMWGLFRYALDGIIDFSAAPLSLAIWLGLGSAFISFVGLVVVIIRHFVNPQASTFGWSSLVCILLMISGVQLFCLGIAGKYIGRIYLQAKHRPVYIVKIKK